MLEASNQHYDIQIGMYTATKNVAIGGKYDRNNAAYLVSDKISEFEIHESLLCPYFTGHFTYNDTMFSSNLTEMLNAPFLYANITFAMVDSSPQNGRPENDNYLEAETFSETVVIDSITSTANEGSMEKSFTFHFSSIDSLNFDATLEPYSTFNMKDGLEDLDKVLKAVFAGANLGEKLDLKVNVPTMKIPFITSDNSTLMTSLDYIYRRSFDCNILEDNSKNMFFKIIYDHVDRKYKVWRFDSIGENPDNELPRPNRINSFYIKNKRFVDCDMSEGGDSVAFDTGSGRNIAVPMYSGNAFELMQMLADKKYYGYDYVTNNFDDNTKEVKDMYKNNLHEHWQPDKYLLKTTLLPNSVIDKSLKFNNSFSRFRENGSVYDIYNEMIFASAYLHVRADGVISRKAGDPIYVNFLNSKNTSYDRLRGDYFITDIRNRYVRNNPSNNGFTSFNSYMECVSPYMMTTSNAQDMQVF